MITTIWTSLRKPLIALSVGLNLAFIGMWLAYTVPTCGNSFITKANLKEPPVIHQKSGITDEQWKQLKPLLKMFRENTTIQRRKLKTLRTELVILLSQQKVDKVTIRAKQGEILSNQRLMQNLVIEHLLSEKNILTPKQFTKLMHYLSEHTSQRGPQRSLSQAFN